MNTQRDLLRSERKELIWQVAAVGLTASLLFMAAGLVAHYAKTPIEVLHIYFLITGGGFATGVWFTSAIALLRIQKKLTSLK